MKHLLSSLLLLASIFVQAQELKLYENYDFVPGEKVLFEDSFKEDKVGASPSHWKTLGGQAVINAQEQEKTASILLYYTVLVPKMKTSAYLPKAYTIEFDSYLDGGYDGNPGVYLSFRNAANEDVANVIPAAEKLSCLLPSGPVTGNDNPPDILHDAFYNKWHHIAISCNNNQMKIYINQHIVLEIPQCNFKATSVVIKGDASNNMPMYFKNFRLAENSNIVSKALAEGKLITHAIRFNVNKAEVRGESMGFIRQVADYLKAKTTTKFEVGGHTDSDGDDNANLKLSEQRASAVKKILIDLGVADTQLTTKGYGETKPISPNTVPDGKANNRRVEFVKK